MVKKTGDIVGGEVLKKDIYLENGAVLLGAGTVLKKEYVQKLQELGIQQVSIKEQEKEEVTEFIKDAHHDMVKQLFEHHVYRQDESLSVLVETAQDIMETILNDKKVTAELVSIQEKSSDLYEHSLNVCMYAVMTALRLKWKKTVITEMATGALLHDIGLRYVEYDYMHEPLEERMDEIGREYRKHPLYGYTAVEMYDWLTAMQKNIVLFHHCCINGTGFPVKQRILAKEIQVVAVCDLFDRRVSGIGCQPKHVYEILEYIRVNAGVLYDKKICDTFVSMIATYPNGSKVKMLTGETGIVIRQNGDFKDRPIVQLLTDQNGREIKEERIIDLMKVQSAFIIEVLE